MDIEREIIAHIETNENNGALLITGKWGCGKSYMLKEFMNKPANREKYAVAMISLFGIDSVAALNDRIKSEYLELNSGFLGKNAIKAYKALGKVVKTSSAVASSAMPESVVMSAINTGVSSVVSFNPLNFVAVKNTVGINDSRRQFILVFDDFERCDINSKDLLGAINEYAENRSIKTVLIADEDKITHESYSEFKEKLISKTLKLQPNFTSIIESIIDKYKETHSGYKNFLNRNKEIIFQVFIESKTENLRSLKAYLIDFERVYYAWSKSGISQDNIKPVFYMFGALTFGVKSGKYKDDSYGGLFADKDIRDLYSNWESTHILLSTRNWIVKGIWDENDFIDELRNKYHNDDLTDDQKFLVYTFWDLEQQYITNGMPIAVQKANAGELTRDELIDLIQKVFALKNNSIPLPCEVDYAKFEEGFERRKLGIFSGTINEPKCRRYVESDAIEKSALSLYNNIKNFENDLTLFYNRKTFCDYLNREANISQYALKGLAIGSLDMDLTNLFLSKYYNAENYLRREMISVILGLGYTDNIFITDAHKEISVNSLKYLIKKINEHTTILTDYISIAINNNFVKHLSELIEKISPVCDSDE